MKIGHSSWKVTGSTTSISLSVFFNPIPSASPLFQSDRTDKDRGAEVRNDLEPGEHTLHCELLDTTADPGGGKEFRIISVMR